MNNELARLRVAVVIPSLLPTNSLSRLIRSLTPMAHQISQVIVVDQSADLKANEQVAMFEGSFSELRIIHSEPGLSRARNVGLEALDVGTWDVVILPDDDVTVLEGSLDAVERAVHDGADAGSGRLLSPGGGQRLNFPERSCTIDPSNIWRTTIEACYFLTPRFLNVVGRFDENLGLGAPTPWKSGEGTDLLLRGIEAGLRLEYLPDYTLVEEAAPPFTHGDRLARARSYARGTGRVYSLRYPLTGRVLLLMKSLARLVRSLPQGPASTSESVQVLFGRAEGLIKWVR